MITKETIEIQRRERHTKAKHFSSDQSIPSSESEQTMFVSLGKVHYQRYFRSRQLIIIVMISILLRRQLASAFTGPPRLTRVVANPFLRKSITPSFRQIHSLEATKTAKKKYTKSEILFLKTQATFRHTLQTPSRAAPPTAPCRWAWQKLEFLCPS